VADSTVVGTMVLPVLEALVPSMQLPTLLLSSLPSIYDVGLSLRVFVASSLAFVSIDVD
jgi:hypothetical protein